MPTSELYAARPALAANLAAHLRRAAAEPCTCPPNVQCPAAPADPTAAAYCEHCGRVIA